MPITMYVRNTKLLKKLNLQKEFEEKLKRREFVVKQNYYYPIEEKLEIQEAENLTFELIGKGVAEVQSSRVLRPRK